MECNLNVIFKDIKENDAVEELRRLFPVMGETVDELNINLHMKPDSE